MARKIRMGVVGVGHFGRLHAEKIARLHGSELVAVADIDSSRAQAVGRQYGAAHFASHAELFGSIDAVSVVVPTTSHYAVAKDFLENGVHVLVEKPITDDVETASELIRLAERRGLVLQVGHLERFSAALAAIHENVARPLYIEAHRVAPYKPRGTDVNVILDVMIHDIDLILALVKAPILSIDAVGAPVVSPLEDIANARIRFANGCVATVTASRVSVKTERKMRIFGTDTYVSVDFGARKIVTMHKRGESLSDISVEETSYREADELESEIDAFLSAVAGNEPPLVTGEDGRRALEAAIQINDSLQSHRELVKRSAEDFGGSSPGLSRKRT